jgi:ankyrin repeat protein
MSIESSPEAARGRSRGKRVVLIGLGLAVLAGASGLAWHWLSRVEQTRLANGLVNAANDGDLAALQAWLDRGADVNAGSASLNTETALMRAAANGRREVVQFLLARGADPNVRHTGIGQLQGRTALMFATDSEQAETVALLLGADADVNIKDALGESAVTLALQRSRPDLARLMVDRGADVNAKNRFGRPTLILGIEMLRAYSGMDESAALALIKAMLDKGADVNAKDSGKTTVTMVSNKGFGLREVMTETGQGGNVDGRTPLMIAVRMGNIQVCQVLLTKGADVNAKDSEGKTALKLARERDNAKVIELLQLAGAKE